MRGFPGKILFELILVLMILIVAIGMSSAMTVAGPVVVVPRTIAQDGLAVLALAVLDISAPVRIVMQPGLRLVEHHLISAIEVVATASGRQGSGKDPMAAVQVYELLLGNIIIGLDRRQIIVVDPVVTCRPPCGLSTYINIYADLDLGRCMSNDHAEGTTAQKL
jgi:hypothetical protein